MDSTQLWRAVDLLESVKRGHTIVVDEQTMQTSEPWLFSGGDGVTGADIAVEALAAG